MHFKFGTQIDIDDYWHMHNRLPTCSGSLVRFNFSPK